MKKGRKKHEIVSLLLTAMIIVVLIFSGSISAVELSITPTDTTPDETTDVSFTVQMDIETGEAVPVQNLIVNITNSSDGSVVATCVFDTDGTEISACTDITINTINELGSGAYTNQWGYGFGAPGSDYINTTFDDGNGFQSTGPAAELIYNITWTTPEVGANTDFDIEFSAYASSGNEFTYKTENPQTLTVQDTGDGAADIADVAAVKAQIDYEYILMDNDDDAKDRVIANLNLPSEINGVTIDWSSSDDSVINITGGVTRQGTDTIVTLNADLTKNLETDTDGPFTLTVKAEVPPSVPDENGEVEVNSSQTEVVFNETTIQNLTAIIAPTDIDDDEVVQINLGELVDEDGDLPPIGNNLTLTRETSTVNYTVDLPSGTVVSGGAGWNGVINLPTVQVNADYSVSSGTIQVVVDVGSGIELNFSEPVMITLGGQRGKRAGWTRGGSAITKITTECNSKTNPTNINVATDPRLCYIDSGSDLIIWTYHFTEFAAYRPSTGGGGGGGSSSTTPACTPSWDCTLWGDCKPWGFMTRDCVDLNNCVVSEEATPITVQTCEYEPFIFEDEEPEEEESPEEIITGDVVAEPEETTETEPEEEVTPELYEEMKEPEEVEKTKEPRNTLAWVLFFIVLVIIIFIVSIIFVFRERGYPWWFYLWQKRIKRKFFKRKRRKH